MNIPPSQWCSIFVLVRVEIREDGGNLRMLISQVTLRPWRKIKMLLGLIPFHFEFLKRRKLLQIRLNFLASKFTWDEISFNLFNDSCLNFVYLILLIETGRNLIDTRQFFSCYHLLFTRGIRSEWNVNIVFDTRNLFSNFLPALWKIEMKKNFCRDTRLDVWILQCRNISLDARNSFLNCSFRFVGISNCKRSCYTNSSVDSSSVIERDTSVNASFLPSISFLRYTACKRKTGNKISLGTVLFIFR